MFLIQEISKLRDGLIKKIVLIIQVRFKLKYNSKSGFQTHDEAALWKTCAQKELEPRKMMTEFTSGISHYQIGHFTTANQINCKYRFAVLNLRGFLWNYCVTGGDIIYWILCYSWLNSWYWMHLCIHHLLYFIIYASGSLLTRTTPCHAHSVFWHFHGCIKRSIKLYYNFCSSSGLKFFSTMP